MSLLNEAILINYGHRVSFNNIDLNKIGATDDILIRSLDTISGDTASVRRFGIDYFIKEVTDISAVGGISRKVEIFSIDDTLLGTWDGGTGTFTQGAVLATAQSCYLLFTKILVGPAIPLDAITIDTDVDVGGLTLADPPDTLAGNGDTLILYIGSGGSTYYDVGLKYGGARKNGTLNNPLTPFFTTKDAVDSLNSANDGVVVLDSERYEEEGIDHDEATSLIQASLGQTPIISYGVGARAGVIPSTIYHSFNAIFFNKNGDDANDGTWHLPKKTIANAITNRGAFAVVYGGSGASASETFTENLDLDNGCVLEADHDYIVTIKGEHTGLGTIEFRNFKLDANGGDYVFTKVGVVIVNVTLSNCDVFNSSIIAVNHLAIGDISLENCNIYNNANVLLCQDVNNRTVDILKSSVHNNTGGFLITGGNSTIAIDIQNNVFYDNAGTDIILKSVTNLIVNGDLDHNTFYNGENGIELDNSGLGFTMNGSIDNNIFESYSDHAIESDFAHTVDNNIFYENTNNYNVNITSTNEILTNPQFAKKTIPYKLGIDPRGSAYRTASDNDDVGAILRIYEINASNITINGITFDGREFYNTGVFILDTVNHTGLSMKWTDFKEFQGSGWDLYDDDTNLNSDIIDCKSYNNGIGGSFSYGGNTIQRCLIYNNSLTGLYFQNPNNTINHNVVFGNGTGIYFDSASSALIIKNNIIVENSLFGIFSEVNIAITFCCITDAVNNVDISDVSNVTDAPNFINTNEGEENFRLKTVENGFVKDSPCKDASDDSPAIDIGAYEIDRDVTQDYWRKHELVFNPRNIDFQTTVPGLTKFINAVGNLDLFGKDDKQIFVFKYGKRQSSNEIDRKKSRYLSTLIKTRTNELPDDRVIMRISFLPSQNLENGTGATIDPTLKSITDSALNLVENEWKGFWAGLIFESDTGNGTIDATAKTLTVSPSPSFIVNEFEPDGLKRFYFHHNGYWYTVLSNTADVLTLSDPEDRLTNQSNIDWNIEKYFKITSCFENEIFLADPNSELISGSFDYYIGFIEVVMARPGFSFIQTRYFFQQETWKTGYQLIFQEVS